MTWRISSKVVCIRDDFYIASCVVAQPKKGQVYVVRAECYPGMPVRDNLYAYASGDPPRGLLLREINNPPCSCRGGIERGFDQCAFRPVLEDESKGTAHVERLKQLAKDMGIKAREKVK